MVVIVVFNNLMFSILILVLLGKLNLDVNLVDIFNGGEYIVFVFINVVFDKLLVVIID